MKRASVGGGQNSLSALIPAVSSIAVAFASSPSRPLVSVPAPSGLLSADGTVPGNRPTTMQAVCQGADSG